MVKALPLGWRADLSSPSSSQDSQLEFWVPFLLLPVVHYVTCGVKLNLFLTTVMFIESQGTVIKMWLT